MTDIVERLRGEHLDCICAAYSSNECCCDTHWPEDSCREAADEIQRVRKERDELVADRNAFLAKELEVVATWSADGIYRYIQQLTDDQFCTKCVRGQCTGDKEGVCCGN